MTWFADLKAEAMDDRLSIEKGKTLGFDLNSDQYMF